MIISSFSSKRILSVCVMVHLPMSALIWSYATNNTFCLHTFEVFGDGTTVYAESLRHLHGGDLWILCDERQNGFASFLSTFSVHLRGFLSTFSVHFGHCTALNGSGMGNNIGAIIGTIISAIIGTIIGTIILSL